MCDLQPPPDSSFVASGAQARNFDCVLSHGGHDAVWIRVSGELDFASGPQLQRALYEGLASARLIVVDLRALSFIDSTGLHTLMEADARARTRDQRLVLVRGPAPVDRLFELAEMSHLLEICDAGEVMSPVELCRQPGLPALRRGDRRSARFLGGARGRRS